MLFHYFQRAILSKNCSDISDSLLWNSMKKRKKKEIKVIENQSNYQVCTLYSNEKIKHRANWSCERCTYVNEGIELNMCNGCFLTRTDAKDLPVQWEWRANPDQWIPYDLASSSELEDSYQTRSIRKCDSTIQQDVLQQYNLSSGGKLVGLEESGMMTTQFCNLLQSNNSVSPDQQVVKLPPCRGHYFHSIMCCSCN
ncbi:unnamed protein product [Rhizophagus irregularis]|nr:unnamed protein product [Rhizophagus irregularis]